MNGYLGSFKDFLLLHGKGTEGCYKWYKPFIIALNIKSLPSYNKKIIIIIKGGW